MTQLASPSPAQTFPDLVEIQRESFLWFLNEGFEEELLSFSPIIDYTGKLELHFLPDFRLGDTAKGYKVHQPR